MEGNTEKQIGDRRYYMQLKMYFNFQNICEENNWEGALESSKKKHHVAQIVVTIFKTRVDR